MLHELKTDPTVFQEVADGLKTFEIRKDDRGFKKGDFLHLRQTKYFGGQMRGEGKPLEYTGREVVAQVTSILRGPVYGLQDGWCIMSITVLG